MKYDYFQYVMDNIDVEFPCIEDFVRNFISKIPENANFILSRNDGDNQIIINNENAKGQVSIYPFAINKNFTIADGGNVYRVCEQLTNKDEGNNNTLLYDYIEMVESEDVCIVSVKTMEIAYDNDNILYIRDVRIGNYIYDISVQDLCNVNFADQFERISLNENFFCEFENFMQMLSEMHYVLPDYSNAIVSKPYSSDIIPLFDYYSGRHIDNFNNEVLVNDYRSQFTNLLSINENCVNFKVCSDLKYGNIGYVGYFDAFELLKDKCESLSEKKGMGLVYRRN